MQQDHKDEKLFALFGLYVLQITVILLMPIMRSLVSFFSSYLLYKMQALISNSVGSETSRWSPIMLQLSHFLHYCGFTYLGLITGHEVGMAVDLISQGKNSGLTIKSSVLTFDLVSSYLCSFLMHV